MTSRGNLGAVPEAARKLRGVRSRRQLRHVALTRKADKRVAACLFWRVAIKFVPGNNNLAGPARFGGNVSVKLGGDDHWGRGSEKQSRIRGG